MSEDGKSEIVQCKRYRKQVSVQTVREFFGVMIDEQVNRGYIVTTGHFTLPAIKFAEGKGTHLIDGPELAELLVCMEEDKNQKNHNSGGENSRPTS